MVATLLVSHNGFESMCCCFLRGVFLNHVFAFDAQELRDTEDKSWDYTAEGLNKQKEQHRGTEVPGGAEPEASKRTAVAAGLSSTDESSPKKAKRSIIYHTLIADEGPTVGEMWWVFSNSLKPGKKDQFFWDDELGSVFHRMEVVVGSGGKGGKSKGKGEAVPVDGGRYIVKKLPPGDLYKVSVVETSSEEGVCKVLRDGEGTEEDGVGFRRFHGRAD